jgi:Helix-turn-helix domain
MKHYKQFTSEQRYQISGLKKAGWKQARIAAKVGVDKSTISRELKRNKEDCGWRRHVAPSVTGSAAAWWCRKACWADAISPSNDFLLPAKSSDSKPCLQLSGGR